jgi:hypothetical protein
VFGTTYDLLQTEECRLRKLRDIRCSGKLNGRMH